jgi:four helix bundle protein
MGRVMKDFKKLVIWQKGIDIVIQVYKISRNLSSTERFGLISQLNRAAISIPSNIAEGNSRTSDKDNRRFAEISLGSCNELETLLIVLGKLELIDEDQIQNLLVRLSSEQKLLSSFINKLKANS